MNTTEKCFKKNRMGKNDYLLNKKIKYIYILIYIHICKKDIDNRKGDLVS